MKVSLDWNQTLKKAENGARSKQVGLPQTRLAAYDTG